MILKKWIPMDGLTNKLTFEGLHYDVEGFRVLLKNQNTEGRFISLSFGPLCFRLLDEGDYLKTVYSGDTEGSLFIVENSSFARWFSEESKGIFSESEITHYAIYTQDECIDILVKYPPVVKFAAFG